VVCMGKDQAIGALILILSIVAVVGYFWLLWIGSYWALVLPVSAGVVVVFVILAWIGWTMATTPPPKPLEPEKAETSSSEAPG